MHSGFVRSFPKLSISPTKFVQSLEALIRLGDQFTKVDLSVVTFNLLTDTRIPLLVVFFFVWHSYDTTKRN